MSSPLLSDVAVHPAARSGRLTRVGMERITLPLVLAGHPLTARVNAGVSLDDPGARGIHMSRLYLQLADLAGHDLTPARIHAVLAGFLASHSTLSSTAFLDIDTEAVIQRPALMTGHSGWKAYPISLSARLSPEGFSLVLTVKIGYSSTCPCSAALARQLIQQQFIDDFADTPAPTREQLHDWLGSEQGIVATPHSQRSLATLSLALAPDSTTLPWLELIDRSEAALATALQTAVKRLDEQAFALANGQNLMFCEDAARRLHHTLEGMAGITGFQLNVVHAESLHAHDAVAHSEWQWPHP